MNNKSVGVLVLICLVFVGGVVNADNFNVHYSVQVSEGWNLLQGFGAFGLVSNFITGGDISSQDISAIFAYLPEQKKYVRIYPDAEVKVDNQDILNSAYWVYSKRSGTIEYSVEEEWAYSNNRKMTAGWNFIGITPDMVGKTMNQIKGTCNYDSIYWYGTEGGKTGWGDLLNNPNFVDKEAWESVNTGMGILIKVSSDCALGFSSSNVNPPSLPTDGSVGVFNCTDSDGGTVIDVKGSISHDGAVSEDYCKDDYTLGERHCNNNLKETSFFDCRERGFSSCKDGRCI